jgi:hypothetical protein
MYDRERLRLAHPNPSIKLSSCEVIQNLKREKYCHRNLHDAKEIHIEATLKLQLSTERLFRMG